jgi:RHS repeat-associated protein
MKNLLRKFPLPLVLLAATLGFSQNVGSAGPQTHEASNGEVSLDTLDIHLSIPIVSKEGVGLPFSMALTYDSNVWYPEVIGTAPKTWYVGQGAWGIGQGFWKLSGPSGGGIIYSRVVNCGNDIRISPIIGYMDNVGSLHGIPTVMLYPGGGTVGSNNCNTVDHINTLVKDGSGFTINAYSGGSTPNSVVGPDGAVIGGVNAPNGVVDVDNNAISRGGSSYNLLTDTMGVTEITESQNAWCGSNGTWSFTYPTSTGTATVTVNCTSYTLQTSFGCSGITEGVSAGNYLPSSISMPDGSQYVFTYESQVAGTITGRIASIQYPTGILVQYAYTGANNGVNCADGSAAGLTKTTPYAVHKFTRTLTSPLTTTLVSDYGTGHANNTSVSTYVQSSPSNPLYLTQAIDNQGASTSLKTAIHCYNTANPTPSACVNATPPTLPITEEDVFTTLTGMSTSSRTSTTYDTYGNVTKSAVYDFGAGTPTRQTVSSGYGYSWNGSATSPNCSAAIGNGIQNKPCQVQLQTGAGATLRNTYFQYSPTGHTIKTGTLVSGSYVTTSATYNTNGSIAISTDVNSNPTTITEGNCNGGVPTVVTPPISSLAVQSTWDCNGAKITSVTDANGAIINTSYADPFWRTTSVEDPLGNYTNTSYASPNEKESILNFGSSTIDVYSKSFPALHSIESQTIEAPSSANWDTVFSDFIWDSTGIKNEIWMPCTTTQGTSSPCTSAKGTTTHDALGRPLVNMDGGNGTITYSYIMGSNVYDVLAVLGPAPSGEVVKQVRKEYNGLGQLLSVCKLSSASGTVNCNQAGGGTGYLTTFTYNVDGTLASAVRGSQTHSFTYDNTGRVITSTTPEGGTKQLFYDSAPSTPGVACSTLSLPTNYSPIGHLLKIYDANGTTDCYSYDQMGRNTGIAYSGTTSDGLNKYFIFDSATVLSVVMANAKGRIAEAYTAATVAGTKVTDEGFSYTLRGEISDVYQWSTHSGGWYHTSATYFANGALTTLAGISGGTWNFGVDGKGRPNTAMQGSTNEVTGATFNAANQPLTITFGLGDVDTYTYDANTGRMASYDFAIKATPVHFTGTPSWNPNGTPRGLTIVDGVNAGADSEVCDYGTSGNAGYDEIGRLVRVNCMNGSTPVWGQNFTYDAYDNLKKTVPTGQTGTSWTPTYNAANNQYTAATYDSNGNLLTDTFHTYTWNQDNHPKAITDVGMTMMYDAFGRMVEKYDGTSYWQELISPLGAVALMKGQVVSQLRVPLPGGATALSGINFEHKDWLGSASFVSNRNRTSTAARLFSPYGEIYNNTGSTGDVDFTGDRQDLTAGLYDTPNRELNPSGRWISPDPAGASWNAYSYTTNPMGETDPSGLGAAGVNSFSFGAGPWGIAGGSGGGGDAIGLHQPDMGSWGATGWLAAAGFVEFDNPSAFVFDGNFSNPIYADHMGVMLAMDAANDPSMGGSMGGLPDVAMSFADTRQGPYPEGGEETYTWSGGFLPVPENLGSNPANNGQFNQIRKDLYALSELEMLGSRFFSKYSQRASSAVQWSSAEQCS